MEEKYWWLLDIISDYRIRHKYYNLCLRTSISKRRIAFMVAQMQDSIHTGSPLLVRKVKE
jgi:hypothetical protein